MSTGWIIVLAAHAALALLTARLLPIVVSRSIPETAGWYERRSAIAQHLLHGLGGLLWPVLLVVGLAWGFLLWMRN